MKTKLVALLASLCAALSLTAASLDKATAVHTRPDAASPTLSVLKAGTTPQPSIGTNAPVGWTAIELTGPHTVYVQNKDLNKALEVRAGASLYLAPKLDSTVLTTAALGDPAEITGLHGRWTQLSIPKTVVGYIQIPATPKPAAPVAVAPTRAAPAAPPALAPNAPIAYGANTGGQAAPMINLGDGGSAALPRLFQGKFASSRRAFAPRRPYEFQLNDSAGERYAYLDLSRVLKTEQIEKYIDHTVAVYGTAKSIEGSKDIVIAVESLQLR